jgi:hypothetical protein
MGNVKLALIRPATIRVAIPVGVLLMIAFLPLPGGTFELGTFHLGVKNQPLIIEP